MTSGDRELNRKDLHEDPLSQFNLWFKETQQTLSSLSLPWIQANAMTLATTSLDGFPSARMVLCKGYDQRGFIFYTNYNSQKAQELEANPRAALVFHWEWLQRSVRISGTVKRLSREEGEEYFHSRPLGSQLGAWASEQSSVIDSREQLEERFKEVASRFGVDPDSNEKQDKVVPLPPFWGGYVVQPHLVEFWQGRTSRLHDRFRYTKQTAEGEISWKIERLSP
eukprot:TRINITY_DN8950_c0_g1_i3.p1 TRINITY_DN8950_c0_g1~~TRINITY_DN8950_c0_g1_i3.p1  ORF type:complete len:224 (+),score=33.35 TRINITY_DN8950_c0_g1_i3:68-739(+)